MFLENLIYDFHATFGRAVEPLEVYGQRSKILDEITPSLAFDHGYPFWMAEFLETINRTLVKLRKTDLIPEIERDI
jgi:hypothetical protein